MKNKNKQIALFLFIWLHFSLAFAQAPTTRGIKVTSTETPITKQGNTYALIAGISNYPNFQKLQYADADAQMFYDELRSPSGGSLPEDNIYLLLNEKATAANFFVKGLKWVKDKNLKEGDRLYIYFAGHGDAVSAEESYLLTYDCDPAGDKNNYSVSGAIHVLDLKNRIRNITATGVEVILIVDACRTNDLPGGADGQRYAESVMEKNVGEILFLSASADESSYEDQQWGGGHGVFTWYLVNGMKGLADEDKNGGISIEELQTFTRKNVRLDTKNFTKSQTPFFYCNSKLADKELSKTDQSYLKSFAAISDKGEGQLFASIQSKRGAGLNITNYNDHIRNLYSSFQKALIDKRLLSRDSMNADTLYNLLLSSNADSNLLNEARIDYATTLGNESQLAINRYLRGEKIPSDLALDYYTTRSKMMRKAMELLAFDYPEIAENLKLKLMYLEACQALDQKYITETTGGSCRIYVKTANGKKDYASCNYYYSNRINKLKECINNGYQKAHDYLLEGLFNIYLDKYDSAFNCFNLAHQLSPGWILPQKYKAELLMFKSQNHYGIPKNEYDSAKYILTDLLKKDSLNPILLSDLGTYWLILNDSDKAANYYKKSFSIDSNTTAGTNLTSFYLARLNCDSANHYYNRIKNDQSFEGYEVCCKCLFANGKYSEALACFGDSVKPNDEKYLAFSNLMTGDSTGFVKYIDKIKKDDKKCDDFTEIIYLCFKEKKNELAYSLMKEMENEIVAGNLPKLTYSKLYLLSLYYLKDISNVKKYYEDIKNEAIDQKYVYAEFFEFANHFAEAKSILDSLNENSLINNAEKASYFSQTKNYRKAISICENNILNDSAKLNEPLFLGKFLTLIDMYVKTGQFSKADSLKKLLYKKNKLRPEFLLRCLQLDMEVNNLNGAKSWPYLVPIGYDAFYFNYMEGAINYKQNKIRDAISYFEKAADANNRNNEIGFGFSQTHLSNNQIVVDLKMKDEMVVPYRSGWEDSPANELLFKLYLTQKDSAKAQIALQNYDLQTFDKSSVEFYWACYYCTFNKNVLAITHLKKAFENRFYEIHLPDEVYNCEFIKPLLKNTEIRELVDANFKLRQTE